MKNVMYILRLTLTLLLITACVALALAGVNAITKDKIAAAQQEKIQAAMKEVLPGYDGFAEVDFTGDQTVKAVYRPAGADDVYVAEVAPMGFGGEITLMVGVKDGQVTGISVVSQSETAGLGAVAADKTPKGEAFRDQYVGKSGTLLVGTHIEAITGATITSKAVTDGVNAALAVKF